MSHRNRFGIRGGTISLSSHSSDRLSVLFVITGLGLGGAERVVVDLADALFAKGHRPVIAYLKGEVVVRPRHAEIPVHCLSLSGATQIPKALWNLRFLVKRYVPDVVHSHLVHANIFTRLARLFVLMRSVVSTAHNTNEESRLRMLAYRGTNWLANASTNVSAEAVAAFERDGAVPRGAMRVIHNGIDSGRFSASGDQAEIVRKELGVPRRDRLLVAVGRLEAQKDYANLLAALRRVHQVRADWQCVIAGEGPLRTALEAQIVEFGLSERIRLLGVRHDIPALLSAADLFVLSSAWEGFPLVVGEAMSCGVPVVATDCGGVSEFLGGSSPYLVPPRDPAALASALLEALGASVESLEQAGDANRARILAEFSLGAAVERWLNLYQELIAAKSRIK